MGLFIRNEIHTLSNMNFQNNEVIAILEKSSFSVGQERIKIKCI